MFSFDRVLVHIGWIGAGSGGDVKKQRYFGELNAAKRTMRFANVQLVHRPFDFGADMPVHNDKVSIDL